MEFGGWVNRLRLSIDNDHQIKSAHVFNMGISGQYTEQILGRMDGEIRPRLRADARTIIVIACGINDTQIIDGRVITDERRFRRNYRKLIRTAMKYTDNVLCVGLTPVDEGRTNPVFFDHTKNWKNGQIKQYDAIIREEAKAGNADYLYMFDAFDPLTNCDGLHPAANGHKAIAEAVRPKIYEYMKIRH